MHLGGYTELEESWKMDGRKVRLFRKEDYDEESVGVFFSDPCRFRGDRHCL
jgi:hypothetical protein